MTSNATIRPQQIARARKLLQELPEKEDKKTRSEAAELLERDFKKAKKKSYNPKELSQMLKNEGIIVQFATRRALEKTSGRILTVIVIINSMLKTRTTGNQSPTFALDGGYHCFRHQTALVF